MDIENAKAQMRKGVLELCILSHHRGGRGVSQATSLSIGSRANDLIVVEGTLYPLLTRLKNDGLLDYTWRESNAKVHHASISKSRTWAGNFWKPSAAAGTNSCIRWRRRSANRQPSEKEPAKPNPVLTEAFS
jgi:hypothetical protein